MPSSDQLAPLDRNKAREERREKEKNKKEDREENKKVYRHVRLNLIVLNSISLLKTYSTNLSCTITCHEVEVSKKRSIKS